MAIPKTELEHVVEVEGRNGVELAHNLALAVVDHGMHLGAEIKPREGVTRQLSSSGNHRVTIKGATPQDMARRLKEKAIEVADHFGHDLEFHDDEERAVDPAATPPVDYPDVTWHLDHPVTGERLDSITVANGQAPPEEFLERQRKLHREAIEAGREQ